MPRDKAEATRQPMAGDRWRKSWTTISRVRVESTRQVKVFEYGNVVYRFSKICNGEFMSGRTESVTILAFRRWAANAEFLGGAE